MKKIKTFFRFFLKGIKWLFFVFVGLLLISALYNLTLKSSSSITEKLTESQKAYIAEYLQLQEEIMAELWPEFKDFKVPVIVYNEEYAFLVGLQNPDAGWYKMPGNELRGGAWEVVANDQFNNQPYYRTLLTDPSITPENFTVKVGEVWVSTMQTREFAEVSFYNGFKNELPPVIKEVFPYKIFWNLIMGEAESYVTALIHESFHGFQGERAFDKFVKSESLHHVHSDYPWDHEANRSGWISESDFLIDAYHSESDNERIQLLRQFINERDKRRIKAGLSHEMIDYELHREWIEGLAKYTELKIGILVLESETYTSVREIQDESDFKAYSKRDQYQINQINEVKRSIGREGDNRFYYTGMLQAMILDQTMPGWKSEILKEDIFLEDLLRETAFDVTQCFI